MNKKSITVTTIFVIFFLLMLVAVAVTAPLIIGRIFQYTREDLRGRQNLFIITTYCGIAPAAAVLGLLLALLRRVGHGRVFLRGNVTCLRLIAWCCFFGAGVAAVSATYYLPWAAVALAALFMGLIVSVVKYVFARAVALQEDADYTV
jgi:hypothetical protein